MAHLLRTDKMAKALAVRRFVAFRLCSTSNCLDLGLRDEVAQVIHYIRANNMQELILMRFYTDEQWLLWLNRNPLQGEGEPLPYCSHPSISTGMKSRKE